jgi:hypothetical protein
MKQLASSLWMSSFDKSDRTTCSKSDECINVDASRENQACCKLLSAGLLQVVQTIFSKLVDNKS